METGFLPGTEPYRTKTNWPLIGLVGVIAVFATVALVSHGTSSLTLKQLREEEDEFQAWMQEYDKVYETEEEYEHRFRTFVENSAAIRIHNRQDLGFILGLNQFADLNTQEFTKLVSRPYNASNRKERHIDASSVPTAVDWRTKGVVTPIKNQGQCGSCWSFSTTGSVEGINAIKSGNLISLSEQQLIDCSSSYGNLGCNGGLMDYAFQYIIDIGGLNTEAAYPYTAADGACIADMSALVDPIASFVDIPQKNNVQLQAAVALQPVSIAIQANQFSFQFYKSGIIKSGCGTQLDHGVLIVGYDTDAYSVPYWIVKNSWGTSWGQDGYVYILRSSSTNDPGVCGIAMGASYPSK